MSEVEWVVWCFAIVVWLAWPPRNAPRVDEWDDLLDGDVTDWQDHYEVRRLRP